MNGYLDAISGQSITISLGGRDILLPRARLGLYLKLGRVLDDLEQAPGWAEKASAIRAYFDLLGVDIAGCHPVEILAALYQLKQFNNWQMTLAFMREPASKGEVLSYDYPDRNWAWVVHKLASRYGWTRHYIMDLYPEEAACYLQEILVSELNEAEERHSLSELAYRYDSVSKRSHYQPLPKPGWMLPKVDIKPVKMLRSMMPYGVIDLGGNEKIYH